MEVGDGNHGQPCGHGSSPSSSWGDFAGYPSGHRPVHASLCLSRIPVPGQPLGFGIGYVMDLGATGSRARIAGARGGTRRSCLGHRRVACTAAPRVPLVVMRESACEFRSSFLPITKRGPLAECLPICLPNSSRRSSLSTAIRLTERPISPERWELKSSRSLAEDTG